MNRTWKKRVREVEDAVATKRRSDEQELQRQKMAAHDHAIRLAALILYGNPQIDEPVSTAWRRALDRLGLSRVPDGQVCEHLRKRVPGADDDAIAAVEHIFETAPRWVLSFCFAALDGHLLGIKLPDFSDTPEIGRQGLREAIEAWPDLPTGCFGAGGPVPKPEPVDLGPNPFDPLTPEELCAMYEYLVRGEENLSRQELRQFLRLWDRVDQSKWPDAPSEAAGAAPKQQQ